LKTYTYPYPKPSVTTDCIIIRKNYLTDQILLIKRKHEPFTGKWALPGGFVEIDEDLEESALRELKEETGISGIELHQFRSYGKPGRDPRGRTISVVYYGFVKESQAIRAGDDAQEADWFVLDNLPALAFDHEMILSEFLEMIKNQ